MGNPRPKPSRLAEKLREVRIQLGLSQTEMLKRLELEDSLHYGRISEYEGGKREPSLTTLLQYARAAGVHMEDLVDDQLALPAELPGPIRHRGLKRSSRSRRVR